MFFPNTLKRAGKTQNHEFHLCLNRRHRRDGALGGPAGVQRWRATDRGEYTRPPLTSTRADSSALVPAAALVNGTA